MEPREFIGYTFAFASGLVIGVLATLLLAPVSGEEMRTQIRERADASGQQIKASYGQGRQWVTDQTGKLRKDNQPEDGV